MPPSWFHSGLAAFKNRSVTNSMVKLIAFFADFRLLDSKNQVISGESIPMHLLLL